MSIYQQQNLGDTMSNIVLFDDQQDEAIRTLERGNTVPTVLAVGLRYISTDATWIGNLDAGGVYLVGSHSEAMAYYNGSAWKYLMDVRHPQLNAGGTIKMAAALHFGGQKATNLAAGTNAGDAIRRDQAVLRNGDLALTGDLSAGNNKITNLAEPTDPNDAARLADLSAASGAVYGKRFRNTGADRVETTETPGTSVGETIIHRLLELGVRPRRIELTFKGRFRDGTDGEGRGDYEIQLSLDACTAQSNNGSTVRAGRMRVRVPGSADWQELDGTYEPGHTGLAGGEVWQSEEFSGQFQINKRFYVEWHDQTFTEGGAANLSGVQIYCIRSNNGELLEFAEHDGGAGRAYCQVFLTGYDD